MLRLMIVTMLALVGCNLAPEDATPYAPPASYRAVWDSAQACTGARGDFGKLRFYSTPGETVDGTHAGMTFGSDIYIAEVYVNHPLVIKHEMIHALGWRGEEHPHFPFETCHATWETYQP